MFGFFGNKPCNNKLREYKIEEDIENNLMLKGIEYKKEMNRYKQLKELYFKYDPKDTLEYGDNYFFMCSYDKNSLDISSEYCIDKENLLEEFNFKTSFFNELNNIVLPIFNIEIDVTKIQDDIYRTYHTAYDKESDQVLIDIYTNDKISITLYFESSTLSNVKVIKLKYDININN